MSTAKERKAQLLAQTHKFIRPARGLFKTSDGVEYTLGESGCIRRMTSKAAARRARRTESKRLRASYRQGRAA